MSSLAGSFLVARSSLQDPNFRRTVVIMLQHNDEGAFGLVVNRPTPHGELPMPVYGGGPCPSPGLMMLHGHRDWLDGDNPPAATPKVAPGIFLGDAECFKRVSGAGKGKKLRFRLFKGYAGWGPSQLEQEMTTGTWAVVPANGHLLFDTPVEDLWTLLAPPTIPEPSLN
jgi:putative transcriptional regulator